MTQTGDHPGRTVRIVTGSTSRSAVDHSHHWRYGHRLEHDPDKPGGDEDNLDSLTRDHHLVTNRCGRHQRPGERYLAVDDVTPDVKRSSTGVDRRQERNDDLVGTDYQVEDALVQEEHVGYAFSHRRVAGNDDAGEEVEDDPDHPDNDVCNVESRERQTSIVHRGRRGRRGY